MKTDEMKMTEILKKTCAKTEAKVKPKIQKHTERKEDHYKESILKTYVATIQVPLSFQKESKEFFRRISSQPLLRLAL